MNKSEVGPEHPETLDKLRCCECGAVNHSCKDCEVFGGSGYTAGWPLNGGPVIRDD